VGLTLTVTVTEKKEFVKIDCRRISVKVNQPEDDKVELLMG
jgi:hypothetical protein